MFENSLIDLDIKRRGRRWWLVTIALIIHVVGGGA